MNGHARSGKKTEGACLLSSDSGLALLMVLWILTILLLVVLSFAFLIRTDTFATTYFKEGAEKKYLAQAGLQRGVAELFYRAMFKDHTAVPDTEEPVKIDGTPYTGLLGNGSYTYRITSESGKIALNSLTDASGLILDNLLVNIGVPKETADTIVDSILDWKDADDLTRLHGAEDDYYMSLPTPYKAKNENFETVEELLLVKGMTPEILYGSREKTGIFDFVTVHGNGPGISLETAPKEVIAALPGVTQEMAERIIEARTNNTDSGTLHDQLKAIVGEAYNLMAQYIAPADSGVYTIEATGSKNEEKKGYTIRAIVSLGANDGTFQYLYYKSPSVMKK
jgi:general secretion pathway protein K